MLAEFFQLSDQYKFQNNPLQTEPLNQDNKNIDCSQIEKTVQSGLGRISSNVDNAGCV